LSPWSTSISFDLRRRRSSKWELHASTIIGDSWLSWWML
jgi:hypothetical protein